MNGMKNFLYFVNDNWTSIVAIIGVVLAICKKSKDYLSKSDDEKIEIAKSQIKEIILKMITDAELDYDEWKGAGSIKRSQVIGEIFMEYPILSKISDQSEIITWMDEVIDEALVTLRKIVDTNKK